MIAYLAGPIRDCTDNEAMDWREEVRDRLEDAGWVALSPMRRDYRGHSDITEVVNEIVVLDKHDIDVCECLLVYFDDNRPSVGTSMEIIYAFEREKPIFVVANQPRERLSPWLIYHTTKFFNSFEEAVDFMVSAF